MGLLKKVIWFLVFCFQTSGLLGQVGPQFLREPLPEFYPDGFDFVFQTNAPGKAVLFYGSTAELGNTLVAGGDFTNEHALGLRGLEPASFHYVRVAAYDDGGDTTFSQTYHLSTKSLSSGIIKAYFVAPVRTSVAQYNTALWLQGAIVDTLVNYINRAEESLDIAIYNWNNSKIASAINAAYNRGVRIRILSEGSTSTQSFGQIDSRIPRYSRPETTPYGIMHHKFVIADLHSEDPEKTILITGSTNWTGAQTTIDPNNVVIVKDRALAKAYTMEFEKMWGGSGDLPDPANAKFGSAKVQTTPNYFKIGESLVELYFSPSDRVEERIIRAINSTRERLYVAVMLMTRTTTANAIANVKNNGVDTYVVLNDVSGAGSNPYAILSANLGPRVFVNNQNFNMHHKYMISDAYSTTRQGFVLTGSHNWTLAANTNNDENTLIIHDDEIVDLFFQDFAARIFENNGFIEAPLVLNAPAISPSEFLVYPNPVQDRLIIKQTAVDQTVKSIILRDVQGKMLMQEVFSGSQFSTEHELSLYNVPKGPLILQVMTDSGVTNFKLIRN